MHSVLLTENDEQLADQWAGAGHESFSETEELEHGSLSELLQIRRPGYEARKERLDVSDRSSRGRVGFWSRPGLPAGLSGLTGPALLPDWSKGGG